MCARLPGQKIAHHLPWNTITESRAKLAKTFSHFWQFLVKIRCKMDYFILFF